MLAERSFKFGESECGYGRFGLFNVVRRAYAQVDDGEKVRVKVKPLTDMGFVDLRYKQVCFDVCKGDDKPHVIVYGNSGVSRCLNEMFRNLYFDGKLTVKRYCFDPPTTGFKYYSHKLKRYS